MVLHRPVELAALIRYWAICRMAVGEILRASGHPPGSLYRFRYIICLGISWTLYLLPSFPSCPRATATSARRLPAATLSPPRAFPGFLELVICVLFCVKGFPDIRSVTEVLGRPFR